MWNCPICKRSFKNTNQSHSCIVTNIESHFINKNPGTIISFERIVRELKKLNDVKINSLKNAILFSTKTHFLAVKPKKDFLDLEFILAEKEDVFPVHKTVQVSRVKWAHFVRIGSANEIDEQMLEWINRAYELSKS